MKAENVPLPGFEQTEPDEDERLRRSLFEAQAARIVELQAEIHSRQEELDELKARILDSHTTGTYMAGRLKVQVKPGRRMVDAKTFERAFPVDRYAHCYQLKPKPLGDLERLLTAERVAGCVNTSKPMVVVS